MHTHVYMYIYQAIKRTGGEVREHGPEGREEYGDVADPGLDAAVEDACVCKCWWVGG